MHLHDQAMAIKNRSHPWCGRSARAFVLSLAFLVHLTAVERGVELLLSSVHPDDLKGMTFAEPLPVIPDIAVYEACLAAQEPGKAKEFYAGLAISDLQTGAVAYNILMRENGELPKEKRFLLEEKAYRLLASESYREPAFEAARCMRCFYSLVESVPVFQSIGKERAHVLSFEHALRASEKYEDAHDSMRSAIMVSEAATVLTLKQHLFPATIKPELVVRMKRLLADPAVLEVELTALRLRKLLVKLEQ